MTLAEFISRIQALLLDDGTLYTTATCTAAIRQALQAYNMRAPIYKTATVTAVSGQYEYDISGNSGIQTPLLVLDADSDPLRFDNYFKDGDTAYIRLLEPQSADFTLVYTVFHTINGLDSESTTTLQDKHEICLSDLAAGLAIVIRAGGRVETVNLNADVSDSYRPLWERWLESFEAGLVQIQRHERMPVANVPAGWDDDWHNWP